MKGAWLEERQLVFRDDLPMPQVREGEALVRVLLAGICNTDIELTRGYYPYSGVPGHEFVGEFEGKRVVGEINASCGTCEACLDGRRTHCERRTVLGIKDRNGSFAEYLALPVENLHLVPDTVENELAVFTEPLAAALEIQEQIRVGPEDRVLVVGNGKLGRLIAASLALTGCKLTVIGRQHSEIAPRSFDVVVECSGNAEGFALARHAVRPRGTIVHEEHLRRRTDVQCLGARRRRDHAPRVTLRPVRSRPATPLRAQDRSTADDPRTLFARRRERRLRVRGAAGSTEGHP